MCCRCCTSLKVAGTWGACSQMVLGSLLIFQFFVLPEELNEYYFFYLAYICILVPLGALILLAVLKEIRWLLKITSTLFILLQLYGLAIRLIVPPESMETFSMLQRILTLFFAIVLTAVYSFILILYARKLKPPAPVSTSDSLGREEDGEEDGDGTNAATAL